MLFSKTHRKKIWQDVRSRKGRTALVSASIFVGVLGVVTLMSVSGLMIGQLRQDLREDQIAMLSTGNVEPEANEIDHDAVFRTLRAYPGVTVAEGEMRSRVFWKTDADESFIESTLRAYSAPFGDLLIEPMTLIEGAFPVAGNKQVALERSMAERFDLAVGDALTIRIIDELESVAAGSGAIPEETWTVSGIVFHPYTFIGASSVYVTQEDAAHIAGVDFFRRFMLRFTDFATAEDEFDEFIAAVEAQTPYQEIFGDLNNPAEAELISEIRQWTDTLNALGVIAMLVASFLVVTVINNIIVEQRRQIGVLKSIGATRADNFGIYSSLALAYGIIGTLPGLLLGIPAGYLLTVAIAPLANVHLDGFAVAPTGIVVGALLGVGVPVIASSLPVYRGTRVTILDAMTDFGLSGNYGRGLLAKIIRWIPATVNVRQGLANLSQKKGRLLLTGLTLTLAAGAFMGVSAVFISLNKVIDTAFDTFNTSVIAQPDAEQDFETVAGLIQSNIEAVAAVYPAYDVGTRVLAVPPETIDLDDEEAVRAASDFLFINGFDTATDAIRLNLSAGNAWADDPARSGIVLTETSADDLGKTLGDTLVIVSDGQAVELQVIGIDQFPFEGAFMRWQELASIFEEAEIPASDEFWIRLSDENASAGDADRLIADLRELLLTNGITASFDNQLAEEEENNQVILTVALVFNIASLVMAAIGGIGLLASLSISVWERQREIGVMRSVGAGTLTIVGQFLTEGILVGALAWAIGVPLSIGVGVLLTQVLPIDFDFSYPPISLVMGFVGMVVIALIASIWPSVAAARKTVSDILRYQ